MTWYAFKVTPQLERRAWDGLSKIGIQPARLEVQMVYRGRDGRRRGIMRPLLPSYAMADVRGPIPWPLLRMIEWQGKQVIRGVLRSGSIPAEIPADEVDRLAQYLASVEPDKPGTIRPGSRARISIGRHDDREAVVHRVLSETRCAVMMRFFGSDREVETTVERLKEAG